MNSKIEKETAFEISCQPLLDAQYARRGWQVDRSSACREYDVVLSKDGRQARVEEKIRSKDYGDLLLELVQDVVDGNTGWFSKTQCDLLSYAVVEDGELVTMRVLRWPKFKSWACQYMTAQGRAVQYRWSTKGYGLTLNAALRWEHVPDEMIAYEYKG